MKYEPIKTKIEPKYHPVRFYGQTEEEKQRRLKAAEEKRQRKNGKRKPTP